MKKQFKVVIAVLLFLGIGALLALYLSSHNVAVLNPKGLIAAKQRELIITSSLLMLIVVIPVLILAWAFAWKYREGNEKAKYTPEWEQSHLAEAVWWGVPIVIIAILAIITWKTTQDLNPFKPIDSGKKPLTIQVVALRWKWLFIYPEEGIAAVNFVQFPTNTPLNFEITADAPMNSFWIPQLGGQIYAMPAMRSKLHLIANEIGDFRGSSANISGTGFAGMTFQAKASSEEDFRVFVQSAKQSSHRLTVEEYRQLIEPTEYHPVTTYVLEQSDLFDRILMKYNMPAP